MLRETLATAHPLIPFVTEELWDLLPGTEGLLATGALPAPDDALRDPAAEAAMDRAIEAVRVAARLARLGRGAARRDRAGAARRRRLRRDVPSASARLARFGFDGPASAGRRSRASPCRAGSVAVLAVRRRRPRRGASGAWSSAAPRCASEIERAERKLANEGFVAKAPAAVVDAERAKLDGLRAELEAL